MVEGAAVVVVVVVVANVLVLALGRPCCGVLDGGRVCCAVQVQVLVLVLVLVLACACW